jgi:hypothetical protein
MTPHAGEMAQLAGINKGDIEADPLGTAREVASHLSGIVVLKGATTHVVTHSRLAYRHLDGVVRFGHRRFGRCASRDPRRGPSTPTGCCEMVFGPSFA